MNERLKGEVIIVAGGGGIGNVLARRYAREGAGIVLGDIIGDHALQVAAEIRAEGFQAVGTTLDGGDDGSIGKMVALAKSEYGKLTGFHANYVTVLDPHGNSGVDMDLADYDEMMRVNLRGYLLCTRHAIPAMIENGGGSLVFTSSVEAFMGAPLRFTYAMGKAALHALMRNIAVRYGPDGIRTNVITPGLIVHPKLEAGMPPGAIEYALSRTALKTRVGRPEDIAAMGAYLLSSEAGYVTGQVMTVDGGGTMRP